MTRQELDNMVKESLRDWFKKEKWVRISTSGNIAGPCGTSKNKKNPDRCLPKAKAQSLTKAQRAATARKKKKAGAKGKTVVKNTKAATVKREHISESLKSAIEKEMRANDGRFETPFPTRELRQILNTKDHSELGDSAKKVLAKLKKKYDLNENIDNNIEALITLVKSAKNPKNLPIYFGTRSVGIGQTQYDKGELVDMFNGRELGMDSMAIRNVFFKANQDAENIADEINASNSGVVAKVEYGYGKEPILYLRKGTNLDEAKKKKKDPPIGKPKRGGSKAYYVYVRDPKTKKIKKVSFGSGGLRAKINNPKARKAFAARHKCSQKTDRTKASYWSCRLPRYAKALGLGNNKNTFW